LSADTHAAIACSGTTTRSPTNATG
jgi:hypothetical protein